MTILKPTSQDNDLPKLAGITDKNLITKISFLKNYTPTKTAIQKNNLAEDNTDSIKSYIDGNELIITSLEDIYANSNCSYMFLGYSNITSLNFLNFNTSKVTNMCNMFAGLTSLISLDLSNFDTSKVTNIQEMFNGCQIENYISLSAMPTSWDSFPISSTDKWISVDGTQSTNMADFKNKLPNRLYTSPEIKEGDQGMVTYSTLFNIAKAVREKNGTTINYLPQDISTAIRAF